MEGQLQGVEGIIFELDSVLFDRADWVLPATEYAAQQMRLDTERAVRIATDYIAKQGGADPQIYNAILLGCGQFDTAMNIRAFTSLVNQFQPGSRSISLYPGVEETLLELRDSLKLAVVTDGPPDTQKRKVIALGLNELVGTIIFSDEIDGIKSRLPDSRPLLEAAARMRLEPAQILFVGHNPVKHFQRTREIGFATVRVLSGEYGRSDYPSEEHRADHDIPSVASLPALMPWLEQSAPPAPGQAEDPAVSSANKDGAGQWGEERSWPVQAPAAPAVLLTADSLPAGTQFEDAAFAALFQMTEPLAAFDPPPAAQAGHHSSASDPAPLPELSAPELTQEVEATTEEAADEPAAASAPEPPLPIDLAEPAESAADESSLNPADVSDAPAEPDLPATEPEPELMDAPTAGEAEPERNTASGEPDAEDAAAAVEVYALAEQARFEKASQPVEVGEDAPAEWELIESEASAPAASSAAQSPVGATEDKAPADATEDDEDSGVLDFSTL